jgi:hypothetical protein
MLTSLLVGRGVPGPSVKADSRFAYGSPSIRFRAERRELAPDESEQAAVATIIELRTQGRSLREIPDMLDQEGVTSKRGERWHAQTIRRVLERRR